jgi:diguanylate cyclase (GGDEF)-like protein
MTGLSAGAVIAIEEEQQLFVGRSRETQVQLDDQGVSRVHCRIVRSGDFIDVEDLGSTNGTRLNGEPMGIARLEPGDRLQIGPHVILKLDYVDDDEEELAKRLFEASTRDPLTNVFNRRYFAKRLDGEIAYARRHGTTLAVMLVDLDRFKEVNDNFGHAAGDAVLRAVARSIERSIRTEDVFARWGGEEFAVLVRVGSMAGALVLAERIRSSVAKLDTLFNGISLRVTASIGVADLASCGEAVDANALVELADRSLYVANVAGRDRVEPSLAG